jgi:hypothetical protein
VRLILSKLVLCSLEPWWLGGEKNKLPQRHKITKILKVLFERNISNNLLIGGSKNTYFISNHTKGKG